MGGKIYLVHDLRGYSPGGKAWWWEQPTGNRSMRQLVNVAGANWRQKEILMQSRAGL